MKHLQISAAAIIVMVLCSGCVKPLEPIGKASSGSALAEMESEVHSDGEVNQVSTGELLKAKVSYIGNASADGKLVELVKAYFGIAQGNTMELQTSHPPYGMALHFTEKPNHIAMQKAASVLISLIGNCSSVQWDYPIDEAGNRESFYLSHLLAEQMLDGGTYIKEYGQSERSLGELLSLTGNISTALPAISRAESIDEAVSAAILEYNRDIYLEEEVTGEGHLILERETEDNRHTVYVQAMYGSYQFQNGNFVKNSGSGAIPTVITLTEDPDGRYRWTHYQQPVYGVGYEESVKRLFPEKLWELCIDRDVMTIEKLTEQERMYASAYLNAIGREAVIGDYSDFEYTSFTNAGISAEMSNKLENKRKHGINSPSAYAPDWIGSVERVEGDTRYVYESSFIPEDNEIVYTKTNFDTKEIIQKSVVDIRDGGDAAETDYLGIRLTASQITPSGMILVCNQSDRQPTGILMTGGYYWLERDNDGRWEPVVTLMEEAWNDLGYIIPENDRTEWVIDWDWLYGRLQTGTYRIGKRISDFREAGDYDTYLYYTEFHV